MIIALKDKKDRSLTDEELARAVTGKGLYQKKARGALHPWQVASRAAKREYRHLFEMVIKLR